jgi:hypothetical protein
MRTEAGLDLLSCFNQKCELLQVKRLMLNCPRDTNPLVQRSDAHSAMWACGVCFGGFMKSPPNQSFIAKCEVLPREEWDPQVYCPEDGTKMTLVEAAGVAIDVCPKCNGVWLDDDEIEQLQSVGLSGSTSPNQSGTDSASAGVVGADDLVSVAAAAVFVALFGD